MTAPSERAGTRLAQTLLTGGLLVVGMALALAGQALIAYFFGAGQRADALFLARDVADLALKLLLPAQAAGVLLPLFVTLRTQGGPGPAWSALSAILVVVMGAATPLVLMLVLLAPTVVALLAPGFDDATSSLAASLLRIVAPTLWFALLGALCASVLQARERFGRAMAANALGAGAMVVAIAPLVHWLGIEGAALAMLVGAGAQGGSALAFLVAEGLRFGGFPFSERAAVTDFVRRTAPFLSYAAASTASGIVLRVSASTLATGLYAVFSLASRLYRALFSLLLTPIQVVLLPALARTEATGRRADTDADLVATMRHTTFVVAPITAVLVALSGPTVSLVFERGAFDPEAADRTAVVLALFALALVPSALYVLLEQAAYAQRRTGTVVRVNVTLEIVQAALYYPLIVLVGVEGIPIAATVGVLVAAVLYGAALRPGDAARRPAHLRFALQVLLCSCVSGAAAWLSAVGMAEILDPAAGLAQAVVVLPAVAVAALAYVAAAHLLKLREPAVLAVSLRQVLRLGASAPRP